MPEEDESVTLRSHLETVIAALDQRVSEHFRELEESVVRRLQSVDARYLTGLTHHAVEHERLAELRSCGAQHDGQCRFEVKSS